MMVTARDGTLAYTRWVFTSAVKDSWGVQFGPVPAALGRHRGG